MKKRIVLSKKLAPLSENELLIVKGGCGESATDDNTANGIGTSPSTPAINGIGTSPSKPN